MPMSPGKGHWYLSGKLLQKVQGNSIVIELVQIHKQRRGQVPVSVFQFL